MPSLIWVNQFALLPRDGGGTRHFELGRELVRRGWNVSILAADFHLHARKYTRRSSAGDRESKCEVQDGVELRWLWAAPYSRNDWRRARNWMTFYRSVVREARRFPHAPDVVIGSSPQIFAASAGRALARKFDVPFVFEVRDLWPESLIAAGGRKGIAHHLIERAATGLYRDAHRILVLARGTADYLVGRGIPREKLAHVPNGVDVSAIKPAAGEVDAAARRDNAPVKLIYAGAHGPANGLDRVLDAAEILGPAANVRFILVGDGPSKGELREHAARRGLSNVEFRDPVSKFALSSMLNSADAGLMVLRESPLFAFGVSPNKLFDYLAAGLPVVCNVPGEVAEMLASAQAGVQAADGSAAALAEGIRALVRLTPEQRRMKAEAGRRWVEREHSREALGERLDAFLRQLMT